MTDTRQRLAALALLLTAGFAPSLRAEDKPLDHEQQYRSCLALSFREPMQAFESAQVWESRGGGRPARHCAALALMRAGQYSLAAQRLEKLAAEQPPDAQPTPSELMAQAANVWLLGDKPQQALIAIDTALQGAPDDARLLVDRALILAELGQYEPSLADLDKAVVLAPEDDDAAAFRAAALRHLGRSAEALKEAGRAVGLNPENASAHLELGLARLATGDKDGARETLVETAAKFSGTPAADAAREQIEKLDLNPDK